MSTPEVDRLRAALDMADAGVDLMRQNLRRANLEADAERIDDLLREWIDHRSGAEHGDCPGRLRTLPSR